MKQVVCAVFDRASELFGRPFLLLLLVRLRVRSAMK